RLAAKKGSVVHQEAAAAAELEIRVENWLAGSRDSLHDAIPAVHLVNEVAVNVPGDLVLFEQLLGLLLAVGQRGDELESLALTRKSRVDALHGRAKVESFVGPVRSGLLLAVQGIDDADTRLLFGLSGIEPGGGRQDAQGAEGCGACPGEEVAPVHGTAGTAGGNVV